MKQASYINESKELFKTSNILEAMVPQDSIPLDSGPLFFFIYINRLSHDLASSTKLFADETFLFSVVKNMTKSRNDLKMTQPKEVLGHTKMSLN